VKKIKQKTLSSIFKDLDSKNIEELDDYYIPDLLSLDALRVILYKYSLSILFYQERLLLYNDEEDLHQYRINIRKSRAFLKEFNFLFPRKIHTYYTENLTNFATQTNKKRDLDVINNRLMQLDERDDTIHDDIRQQQRKEQRHIQKMLKAKTFKKFFLTYQETLKGKTLLRTDNNKENIEYTARKVINKLHYKIIKKITALEEEYDDKKLHKIRISFKKLRYLLEEFQHIFGENKIEKMIDKGKDLQTLLGDINDSVNQTNLLHTYFQSNTNDLSESIELENKLLKKTSKRQKKLIKKAIIKLHKFKEHTLKL